MRESNELNGVILAAGNGSRLYPITEKIPKPLLPIGERPVIEYQLDIMKELGIKKCFIVIGYFGYEIAKHLGDGGNYGLHIEYIMQKEPLGIANALTYAAHKVTGNENILLMLGDIFFETTGLREMVDLMDEKQANGILATKIETDPNVLKKNFAIYHNEDGRVHKVVEKPTRLVNNLKGCGMYLFDGNIFEAVNRTPRTALRNEYELTDSIQIFIDSGYKVYYANVIVDDMNITYLKDLYKINMDYLRKYGKNAAIGVNVSLGDNVRLNNVVIGNNVSIGSDVTLSDSIVLSDVFIENGENIQQSIVTKDNILPLEV